ncbi:MAG: hypothetical protein HN509_12620 [Halobacteriovoraceae bacterium]|jgi:hypothetical protein|nr:hypothetical protein [Halobacteriovoraceae bacterium]MBT5095869.1 hypothetical protein [Halobacteriovoraceae bacterium]
MKEEYPKDFFIKLDSDDYRIGRLTLTKITESFNVEIDIVSKENKKIWAHIDVLYNLNDPQEALDRGVQRLSEFLNQSEN